MNEKYFPNTFRRRLQKGEPLIGCWSALGNPIAAEIIGLAGFDWILLDAEHAPNDIQTFIPQLMALKDSISMPVVRPVENRPSEIKRLLDIGFYNFLVPFVESEEEAKSAVASTRYPPHGIRGVSVGHRSNGFGSVPGYFEQINENITVVVQIESQKALDNLDSIILVEGVDGVFVGPSDLAAGLGHLGDPNHPDVQYAIKHIIERAQALGKSAGILAPVKEDAQRYLCWGATMVAVGGDLGLLRKATQNLCEEFRN
ncbi:2-dehydro-3-deoxyglucarate aldolase [Photobacterium sagamiensis]|uniref:2-dehydro-3-deoxyglucarate aldolase n=1 Tax=Photobacterium sagamiensis TaxID=2910241 RepID=UPI003D149CFE